VDWDLREDGLDARMPESVQDLCLGIRLGHIAELGDLKISLEIKTRRKRRTSKVE
jgi:hypothetical protein